MTTGGWRRPTTSWGWRTRWPTTSTRRWGTSRGAVTVIDRRIKNHTQQLLKDNITVTQDSECSMFIGNLFECAFPSKSKCRKIPYFSDAPEGSKPVLDPKVDPNPSLPTVDVSALTDAQKEQVTDIRELEKLLPQLKEKITDIRETKESFTQKVKALKVRHNTLL